MRSASSCAQSFDAAELDVLRIPAGLDLGSTTHKEMAVCHPRRARPAPSRGRVHCQAVIRWIRRSRRRSTHLRHDGRCCRHQPSARSWATDVLLLLPGLPGGLAERDSQARRGYDADHQSISKSISHRLGLGRSSETSRQVATCLPGTDLTEEIGDDHYGGGRHRARAGQARVRR